MEAARSVPRTTAAHATAGITLHLELREGEMRQGMIIWRLVQQLVKVTQGMRLA